jgi:protein O-GlcNAc transferase
MKQAEWARCISQLRIINPDEPGIHASRKRYAEELASLRDTISIASLSAILAAAEAVGILQPFYLTYQGLKDREL